MSLLDNITAESLRLDKSFVQEELENKIAKLIEEAHFVGNHAITYFYEKHHEYVITDIVSIIRDKGFYVIYNAPYSIEDWPSIYIDWSE